MQTARGTKVADDDDDDGDGDDDDDDVKGKRTMRLVRLRHKLKLQNDFELLPMPANRKLVYFKKHRVAAYKRMDT